MTSRKTSLYWRLCWAVFTPCIMIIIFIYMLVNIKPLQYSDLDFPDSATAAGWIFFAIGVIQFPLWAIWLLTRKGDLTLWEALQDGFLPHNHWGPKDKKLRNEWIKFKKDAIENRELIAQTRNHSKLKQKIYILLGKY